MLMISVVLQQYPTRRIKNRLSNKATHADSGLRFALQKRQNTKAIHREKGQNKHNPGKSAKPDGSDTALKVGQNISVLHVHSILKMPLVESK